MDAIFRQEVIQSEENSTNEPQTIMTKLRVLENQQQNLALMMQSINQIVQQLDGRSSSLVTTEVSQCENDFDEHFIYLYSYPLAFFMLSFTLFCSFL